MYLLEREAITKRCPFYFLAVTGHEAGGDGVVNINCKGSDCMMWRWAHKEWACQECGGTGQIEAGACAECGGQGGGGHPDLEPTGYCGMAGRPAGIA